MVRRDRGTERDRTGPTPLGPLGPLGLRRKYPSDWIQPRDPQQYPPILMEISIREQIYFVALSTLWTREISTVTSWNHSVHFVTLGCGITPLNLRFRYIFYKTRGSSIPVVQQQQERRQIQRPRPRQNCIITCNCGTLIQPGLVSSRVWWHCDVQVAIHAHLQQGSVGISTDLTFLDHSTSQNPSISKHSHGFSCTVLLGCFVTFVTFVAFVTSEFAWSQEPRIPLSLAAPALVYARFSMEVPKSFTCWFQLKQYAKRRATQSRSICSASRNVRGPSEICRMNFHDCLSLSSLSTVSESGNAHES